MIPVRGETLGSNIRVILFKNYPLYKSTLVSTFTYNTKRGLYVNSNKQRYTFNESLGTSNGLPQGQLAEDLWQDSQRGRWMSLILLLTFNVQYPQLCYKKTNLAEGMVKAFNYLQHLMGEVLYHNYPLNEIRQIHFITRFFIENLPI